MPAHRSATVQCEMCADGTRRTRSRPPMPRERRARNRHGARSGRRPQSAGSCSLLRRAHKNVAPRIERAAVSGQPCGAGGAGAALLARPPHCAPPHCAPRTPGGPDTPGVSPPRPCSAASCSLDLRRTQRLSFKPKWRGRPSSRRPHTKRRACCASSRTRRCCRCYGRQSPR